MPSGCAMTERDRAAPVAASTATPRPRSIRGLAGVFAAARTTARSTAVERQPNVIDRIPMQSASCQICGPNPQPCPTVLCVPCVMVTSNQADQASDTSTWSFKRLAWAFGCAATNSDRELELFRELKRRIGDFRP